MLKSQKPSGSAHVVILVILIIALLGILGFIFWHKYSNQKTETSVTSSASNSLNVDPYKDWNTYEASNSKYEIKYPKNWIALKETVSEGPYIRNFDPTSKQSQDGYPDGYINLQVYREENDASFKAKTGYTTTEWYEMIGKSQLQNGAAAYAPEFVKDMKISGLSAKSAKAAADEVDEVIYVMRGDVLYSMYLYPYGISSDPTVKLMLDSFTFTY